MPAENISLTNGDSSIGLINKMAKKLIISFLGDMKNGYLTFEEGNQQFHLGNLQSELHAKIIINDVSCYAKMLLGGSIGAGEAYMQGLWTSPDLTKVIQVLAREQVALDKLEKRFARFMAIPSWIYHKARKNTQSGSKKNILEHYDLGNDMYQQFLDKEMLYSSAIYPNQGADLEQAQLHKLETICQRLDLKKGETLLEIGTGWGALAIYAAQNYAVKVTTTTISDAQYDYTKARIEALGLTDNITLLKQDYRELTGEYDKLVSIEMIEAVGHEYLASFFETCNKHLKSDGKMLIQAITISDQRYHSYRKGVDFIQRYIFPGGCLPSVSVMTNNVSNKTDMVVTGLHDIGQDYARTLNHWHQRFDDALDKVKQLGYDDTFIRLWKFYFSYCEGAFLERRISTVHLIAAKPDYRAC